MKRFTRSTLLALLIAMPISALAQDEPPGQGARGAPGGMSGMMDGAPMQGDMMPMMDMMMACASMMEGVHGHGTTSEGMGDHSEPDSDMRGRMGRPDVFRYDAATAEALARAYLSGQASEAAQDIEFPEVTLDAGIYLVTYRRGSAEGVVRVDAATGIVMPEDAP